MRALRGGRARDRGRSRHPCASRHCRRNGAPPPACVTIAYTGRTMSASPRLIAHLDMDAFYASVELLRYPELKGRPVVIGGGRDHQPRLKPDGTREFATLRHYAGRGVITTATYAARAYGVHSGMGLMKAAALAPDAILLPTDFAEYRRYSRLFKAAVAEVAPVIEDRGIDEIYIDLTDVPGVRDTLGHDPLGGVRAVAQ